MIGMTIKSLLNLELAVDKDASQSRRFQSKSISSLLAYESISE